MLDVWWDNTILTTSKIIFCAIAEYSPSQCSLIHVNHIEGLRTVNWVKVSNLVARGNWGMTYMWRQHKHCYHSFNYSICTPISVWHSSRAWADHISSWAFPSLQWTIQNTQWHAIPLVLSPKTWFAGSCEGSRLCLVFSWINSNCIDLLPKLTPALPRFPIFMLRAYRMVAWNLCQGPN